MLIEELQSDWVRAARRGRDVPPAVQARRRRYVEGLLADHEAIWAEALLLATLRFCREILGLERIWKHTFEGGTVLKGIDREHPPPRSLYTPLPRRFGFQVTDEAPTLEKARGVRFQRLPALQCS